MKPVIESLTKLAGFKLKPRFFGVLFIGIILGFGADYYFDKNDMRFRIFIYGASIIIVFALAFIFHKTTTLINYRHKIRKVVNKLSGEDRDFVLHCNEKDEYLQFDLAEFAQFEAKWGPVLFIPTGKVIALQDYYKIFANEHAVKLIKRQKRGNRL